MAKTRQRKQRKRKPDDAVQVKGAFRLQITEDGEVVGDSGWRTNNVVAAGWQNYLAARLLAAGSSVTHIALGTGGTCNASTNALPGEAGGGTNRATIGANTSTSAANSSVAVAIASATFASNAAITGAGSNISNIGLFGSSSGNNLFAGNTYASSPVASNQAVNVTYSVSFGTST